KFDFIVGSDILYESYHPKYFASICTFLAHQNTKVIVTDPGRPYIQNFVNHMKGDGWVEILEPWTVPFKGVPSDVYLLRFERNQ
ncbi:MAG: hypothetical protein NT027_07690, partial [Proteobacteria bacterium]|nr:hypothetical protein [Pseudomonadota bacterium]